MSEGNEKNQVIQQQVVGGVSNAVMVQPLPARNLQDMLRYTTEVTAASGGSQQNFEPIDEESKRFLNEALASMTTDVIEQLKTGIENIEGLLKAGQFSEEDCDAAFEHVLELVDKVDFANDFHKIGGFRVFKPCLSSSVSLMRWRCCELIAELCQNNPYCQDKCLSEGYLDKMIYLLNTDTNEMVKIKALYALSAMVRENDAGLKAFILKNGCSTLLDCLRSDIVKLKIKASFLLSSLCAQSSKIKEDLSFMGSVDLLVLQLACESENSIIEHLLSALQSLVTDFEPAKTICRRSDLGLKHLLLSIVKRKQGSDDKEIVEYAGKILQIVFEESEYSIEGDR